MLPEDERELEANYQTFSALVNTFTPHDAAQRLRLFRVPDEIIERIVARHEQEVLKVRMLDEPHAVYSHNRMTWYTGPQPSDPNWPPVEAMLRRRLGDKNAGRIDDASTKIVGMLDHPSTPTFKTYGLVVGHVQSGKTTNFTAVMAKAADRGYRLFIVFSGIHNALRRQTQIRITDDLVSHNPARWYGVTTPEADFKLSGGAAAFVAAQGQHVLLVVKKNAAVLRRLKKWLETAGDQLDACPTLLIDDEADQATVATKKINPLLAEVMSKFPKVAYVGYTATPFANLLIDPGAAADFYPRHFVVNLPAPDGYDGPEVLFGRDQLDFDEDPADADGGKDMIRRIPEKEVECLRPTQSGASDFTPSVTPSLADAIDYFVLATAARRIRGTGVSHSTMLLHTTVQTRVHAEFRDVVDSYRRHLAGLLERADASRLASLREMWEAETARVPAGGSGETPVAFDDLQLRLLEVVGDTRIIVDNSRSTDRLDYRSGPVTAIVIGGNTLSRGLTLEGLVVSYFVRAVSAYDTLLQMGRWFGYRQGYADLPRIWLTEELKTWFRDLATVEAEMRHDIDRYMVEDVTPETFAVRIRDHPKLAITTAAKMKNAVVAHAAYGGQLAETRYFKVGPTAKAWLASNEAAARRLVARAATHGRAGARAGADRLYFEGVPHDVVTDFIAEYSFHEKSMDCEPNKLTGYVAKRVGAGSLLTWDVAVIGSRRSVAKPYDFGSGVAVGMVTRARLDSPDHAADIKTLTSRRDETVDLEVPPTSEPLTRREILNLRREQRPDVGLVLLYPIDPVSESTREGRYPLNAPHSVVVGVAFVFPEPREGTKDAAFEYTYWSADLSKLHIEEDDLSALDRDEDEDAA